MWLIEKSNIIRMRQTNLKRLLKKRYKVHDQRVKTSHIPLSQFSNPSNSPKWSSRRRCRKLRLSFRKEGDHTSIKIYSGSWKLTTKRVRKVSNALLCTYDLTFKKRYNSTCHSIQSQTLKFPWTRSHKVLVLKISKLSYSSENKKGGGISCFLNSRT